MRNHPQMVDLEAVTGSTSNAPKVGSVQTMYEFDDNGATYLLSKAPDDGSVFDVGRVFTIPGSGVARQTLRHRIYTRLMSADSWRSIPDEHLESCLGAKLAAEMKAGTRYRDLCSSGAQTHHCGLVDPATGKVLDTDTGAASHLVLMHHYLVVKPERVVVAGVPVYDYSKYFKETTRLVALENIVRFGNPGGSSLQSRYDKALSKSPSTAEHLLGSLGLSQPPQPWRALTRPIVEWSTKFEGYDRYLTPQEALLISGVTANQLDDAVDLLLLSAAHINWFLSAAGLQLWDLKFELAMDNGEIVIVDTVDHDSMRVTVPLVDDRIGECHVHFNKQAVRDYYRIFHPGWIDTIHRLKAQSDLPQQPAFKDLYKAGEDAGQWQSPPVDPEFAELQGRKYDAVTAGADGSAEATLSLARQEVEYYERAGRLAEFAAFNAQPTRP